MVVKMLPGRSGVRPGAMMVDDWIPKEAKSGPAPNQGSEREFITDQKGIEM